MFSSESYYRRASAEGATYVGLLVVVYDTLAGDFRNAGAAAARGDIAGRCEATNHALLLLGHLESWVDSLDDAALQDSLRQFYSHLRSQAIALQVTTGSEGFEELARLVAETRATWQQKEARERQMRSEAGKIAPVMSYEETGEREPGQSWSA